MKNMMHKYPVHFTIGIILILALSAVLFFSFSTKAGQQAGNLTDQLPLDFDFGEFTERILDENTLHTAAMQVASNVVEIRQLDEETSRIVPMAEWLYTMAFLQLAGSGSPDQPVYVLAMKGDFVWPVNDTEGNPASSKAYTVAIDALTGNEVTSAGQYIDPQTIVDQDISSLPLLGTLDGYVPYEQALTDAGPQPENIIPTGTLIFRQDIAEATADMPLPLPTPEP